VVQRQAAQCGSNEGLGVGEIGAAAGGRGRGRGGDAGDAWR